MFVVVLCWAKWKVVSTFLYLQLHIARNKPTVNKKVTSQYLLLHNQMSTPHYSVQEFLQYIEAFMTKYQHPHLFYLVLDRTYDRQLFSLSTVNVNDSIGIIYTSIGNPEICL